VSRALEGIRTKLDRAREHRETFEREWKSWTEDFKEDSITIVENFDLDHELLISTITATRDIPPRLGAVVGDAVHNLRSCLDQLTFEIAFLDSGGASFDKNAWPSSMSRDNFHGSFVQNTLLRGVNKTHRARIARYQPYRRWMHKGYALHLQTHPSFLLNELSNDDKHRLIQPYFFAPLEHSIRLTNFRNCRPRGISPTGTSVIFRPLEPDTELLRLPLRIDGPDPDVDVEYQFSIKPSLRNGLPLGGTLEVAEEFCGEVVDDLAPILLTQKAHRLEILPRSNRFAPEAPPQTVTLKVDPSGTRIAGVEIPSTEKG
jgi:hypothetical protein